MLLSGATLLGQPCPYCSGVRVLKDGNALCTNCGRRPEKRDVPDDVPGTDAALSALEAKLESLKEELQAASGDRRDDILRSMDSISESIKLLRPDHEGG